MIKTNWRGQGPKLQANQVWYIREEKKNGF